MFNNKSRFNHSSPTKNTAINEIKHFPRLFSFGPHIPLKQKWYHLLINVYKHKDANNFKSLVQPICLVITKYLIRFFAFKTLFIEPYFHRNFVTITESKLSLFSRLHKICNNTGQWKPVFSHILCSGTCTHFRKFPRRYKINNWFLSMFTFFNVELWEGDT